MNTQTTNTAVLVVCVFIVGCLFLVVCVGGSLLVVYCWWLVFMVGVGGWWLVVGGWWLVVGGWWLVVCVFVEGEQITARNIQGDGTK